MNVFWVIVLIFVWLLYLGWLIIEWRSRWRDDSQNR
jgi:hypothetical protein